MAFCLSLGHVHMCVTIFPSACIHGPSLHETPRAELHADSWNSSIMAMFHWKYFWKRFLH